MLAQELLRSLPDGPCMYNTSEELVEELTDRLQRLEAGEMHTYDADETLSRVREELQRRRHA